METCSDSASHARSASSGAPVSYEVRFDGSQDRPSRSFALATLVRDR
jgi:hypothetical protein